MAYLGIERQHETNESETMKAKTKPAAYTCRHGNIEMDVHHEKRTWVKFTRYFYGCDADYIEEYLVQEGKHFKLTGRIVHGKVSTMATVRRNNKFPVGSIIRMTK